MVRVYFALAKLTTFTLRREKTGIYKMTLSEALNRRIKARTVEDDSENYPESSLGSDGSDAESGGLEQSDAGSDEEMEDEDELV